MTASSISRARAAGALFAAAAAWPSVLCLLTEAMASPLERALRTAWCGSAPQAAEFLGHCPACWTGASALALAGVMVMTAPKRAPIRQSVGR